jgi:hypothetical protein
MSAVRRCLGVVVVAGVLSAAGNTRAAGPVGGPGAPCADAAVDGQKLRQAGRLREAGARFSECAAERCRADIVNDCTSWLRQVDEATPSIVVAARDGRGGDLLDVRVAIDGQVVGGDRARAIPLDPGRHVVVFERAGARPQNVVVVLREGEKLREVVATFSQPASTAAPAPDRGVRRGLPAAAYVGGAVAVAGFAVFGTFGAVGAVDHGSSSCGGGCAPDDAERVRRELLIADVGLGVGLAALAATAIWLLAR